MKNKAWREPTAAEIVREANLRYVNDTEPGYRRRRHGRGFTWRDEKGQTIQDKQIRQRLIQLAIPPAWQDVWICPHLDGHILATGRDAEGRKQYLYHPCWEEARNQLKYERLLHFGEALPQIRKRVEQDLKSEGLGKHKVIAVVVRLLDETGMRIGHDAYTQQHDTYGLTTLCDQHLHFEGKRLILEFVGKSHVEQHIPITDPKLIHLLEICMETKGERLFQYEDENGNLQHITSTDVNQYINECTDMHFSSKDFRTWHGTVAAVEAMLGLEQCEEEDGQKRTKQVVETVAKILGNTPAVCRGYYIHPSILERCTDGRCFEISGRPLPKNRAGYSPTEQLTLQLIASQ